MKHYEVVAAVIEYENKILCMQRGKAKFEYVSYKYEFPGGKVEAGEENHIALSRELSEEMDLDVTISEKDYLLTVDHTYPDFAITMHAYLCKVSTPDFVMKEHISFKWLPVSELGSLDWAEADKPIVKWLKKRG
ncbi:MAG: (deoxy)nucleoside triphosphate pyrophosphohydrolase [Phascolarctobacterium sp.]|nr:(deoxy)nucleoside triphosphate pyrophosphohydrolase [Phascolarctobacterium sp.]